MPGSSESGPRIGQVEASPLRNETITPLLASTSCSVLAAAASTTIPIITDPETNDINSTTSLNCIGFETDTLAALSSLDAFNNELYVTKFTNSTTCEDINNYLRERHLDNSKVKVFRLTKDKSIGINAVFCFILNRSQ